MIRYETARDDNTRASVESQSDAHRKQTALAGVGYPEREQETEHAGQKRQRPRPRKRPDEHEENEKANEHLRRDWW